MANTKKGCKFTVEMGFDRKGLRQPGNPFLFLPNDVAQDEELHSYCRLKRNDKIQWRIFDITNIGDGKDGKVTPKSLDVFYSAARVQKFTSPFKTSVNFGKHELKPRGPLYSTVFGGKFYAWDAKSTRYGKFRRFFNKGFFFASYVLSVQVGGRVVEFQTDPEMIIHP